MNTTYFALLAEFGAAEIPLEDVAPKYFSMSVQQAKRAAATQSLPVPAYRATDSQKGRWLVSATHLAAHLDKKREDGLREWEKVNGVRCPRGEDAYSA